MPEEQEEKVQTALYGKREIKRKDIVKKRRKLFSNLPNCCLLVVLISFSSLWHFLRE